MGVQALHSAVPGNLRSHRNLADHGQGRQLFQEERVGQDGRGLVSTQETQDAMRYGGPSSAKCWAWGQGRGDRERLGSVDSTRGQTDASDHDWGFLAGWQGTGWALGWDGAASVSLGVVPRWQYPSQGGSKFWGQVWGLETFRCGQTKSLPPPSCVPLGDL